MAGSSYNFFRGHLINSGTLGLYRDFALGSPNAGTVTAQSWDAFKCDANACATVTASRTYLPLTPLLNAAGWYQKAPLAPLKLSQAGTWNRWTNITGLIPNVSIFGEEIRQRVTPGQLAASSLRDAVAWVWDGTVFKLP